MQRRHLIAAISAALAAVLTILGAGAHVAATTQGEAATRPHTEFNPGPQDRPLLESPKQVEQARTTGVCSFKVGTEHFVVTNLPKEYVDYSSWRVRMP